MHKPSEHCSATNLARWVMGACALFTSVLPDSVVAAPDTLFVTWDRDPSRTATLQWLAPGLPLPLDQGPEAADAPLPPALAAPLPGGMQANGDLGDWPAEAYRSSLCSTREGVVPAPADCSLELRLGWMPGFLAISVSVRDDHLVPSPAANQPWQGDGLEIFLRRADGSHRQFALSRTDDTMLVFDRAMEKGEPPVAVSGVSARLGRGVAPDGRRVFELMVPLSDLGLNGAVDEEIGVQVLVTDLDPERPRRSFRWHPRGDNLQHADSYRTVRLGTTAGGMDADTFRARYADARGGVLELVTTTDRAGEPFVVQAGNRELGVMTPEIAPDGLARARYALPEPKPGHRWGTLRVRPRAHPEAVCSIPEPPAAQVGPPPPEQATVWREDQPEAAKTFQTSVHAFGESSDFVHRLRLDGLAPDTRYFVRVGEAGELASFRTLPAELESPLVFAEGGDIGTGPVVAKLHQLAASWSPRFALVGGDLAYCDGVRADRWWHYLREWHRHMRTSEGDMVPMLACIGNHEVRGGNNGSRADAPFFYAFFDGLFSEHGYAALDFGNWLSLLLLDSGHTAPVAGPQTEWLGAALTERRDRTHRLIAWHVPGWPSNRDFDGATSTAIREHWVPLLEADPPGLVFEHHDHTYKRTHRLRAGREASDGVLYVGDGNWGRGSRPVHADRPYLAKTASAFNVLRITLHPDGRGEVLVVDENGRELDAFDFARNSTGPGANP